MRRSLFDKYICIVAGWLGFSFVIGFIMMLTGDVKEIPLTLGVMSIIGFAFMFFFGFIYSKSPEDQQQLDADYYISLVTLSKDNPKQFNKEYKGLIGHGTRYIVLLFILVILSLEGIIAIGVASGNNMGAFGILGAGLVGVLYTIIRSLYIKSFPIEGYEITAKSSPEIIKTIEEARVKTNSPTLDKIIVGDGANCGVTKNPLGFGSKSENALFIGLYFLMLLTPEELESIYIHEFAHIYRKDTHISNKINRIITRWSNVLANLQNRGFIANTLLKGFAENYITKMQFYFAADSKSKEVSADKEAAKFSSKEIYAKATMKIELIEYYFNLPAEKSSFDLRTFDTAPTNAHDLLIDSFLKQLELNKDDWKTQILKRISNKADTHPSYKERMAEIGVDSFDFEVSFAKSNLPEIRKIVDDLNAEWHKNMAASWEDYTTDYKKSQELIRGFEISEDNDKNAEYAMALEELAKTEEALKIYENILEKNSQYAPALFRSGMIYLNREDEKGLEFVKLAMEQDNDFIDAGLQIIAAFLDRNGLKDKKEELKEWASEQSDIYNKKTDEAENLYTNEVFAEACISNEQRQKLKEDLENIPTVKTVFIATKKLKYSKHDLLVVGIVSKQKTLKLLSKGSHLENTDEIWEVLNTLETPCFLLDLNTNAHFTKQLSLVNNSELIRR